jgi:hypothetical protein
MKVTFLLIAFCSGFLATLVVAQPLGNTDEQRADVQRADVQRDMARELAPIKSAETLRAYRSITPDATSPLAKLSVKGRAEFLASLVFSKKELAGFSTRVLENELSASEIYSVLALFGAQHLTPSLKNARIDSETDRILMGLPKALNNLPIPAHAVNDTALNAQAKNGPQSVSFVELQLDALLAAQQDLAKQRLPWREQANAVAQKYIDLAFKTIETRSNSLSNADLNWLLEAQLLTNLYAKDGEGLAALEYSFAELEKRDNIQRKHVQQLFSLYISIRRFDAAAALAKKYSAFNLEALPRVVANDGVDKNLRAIWLIDKAEKHLTREPVHFSSDWQLVAISHPLCHFSKNALTYIKNDKVLAKSFEGHLTLIGPQDGNLQFDVMQKWNAENPSMRIHPVDQQIAFTEFDQWSTPTFYFMKAGKVVYKFNGWPKEGNRAQLDEGLRKVGAMSAEAVPKK